MCTLQVRVKSIHVLITGATCQHSVAPTFCVARSSCAVAKMSTRSGQEACRYPTLLDCRTEPISHTCLAKGVGRQPTRRKPYRQPSSHLTTPAGSLSRAAADTANACASTHPLVFPRESVHCIAYRGEPLHSTNAQLASLQVVPVCPVGLVVHGIAVRDICRHNAFTQRQ